MTNERDSTFFTLVPGGGPNKFDLSMAFFNAFENGRRVPSAPYRVTFTAVQGEHGRQQVGDPSSVRFEFYARIMEISHEDGSEESFNLRGYINSNAKWGYAQSNGERKFEGYLNTRNRTGWLSIENPESGQDPDTTH